MWKIVPATATTGFRHITARTFLSNAYKCTDEWNARLTAPILQKIKPEQFYYELEQKFQHHGKCSAIDIDIFANRLNDTGYLEEVADLVHRHRLTEETTNTFESTGHALIRCYLDHAADNKDLLEILDDRLSYGVFLDSFTANLALNQFILAKDYTAAARIASFMMLQEDFTNPITRALSLFACVKYLQDPQPFEVPAVAVTDASVTPATADKAAASKKKKEEVRVRVAFLRNEFFDDHFDLRDGLQLVGKSLNMIGKSYGSTDVGRTAQLLGSYHSGEFALATDLLLHNGSGLHKDIVDAIVAQTNTVTDGSAEFSRFADALKALTDGDGTKLSTDDFEKVVCALAHNTVTEHEAHDIGAQTKVYADWFEHRQQKLTEELERLKRIQRLDDVERLTAAMETEEQRLWFFENEDKIDLTIDSKQVRYRKRWFGKKKKPRVIDAGYIPPEIQVQRNK